MNPSTRLAVLDDHPAVRPGLERPGVAIFTTVADDTLALAGALAGVGAVLAESSSPVALLEAIRMLARAPRTLQSVSWATG
jgi:DNA-binding NarL/FixJ family response regulator